MEDGGALIPAGKPLVGRAGASGATCLSLLLLMALILLVVGRRGPGQQDSLWWLQPPRSWPLRAHSFDGLKAMGLRTGKASSVRSGWLGVQPSRWPRWPSPWPTSCIRCTRLRGPVLFIERYWAYALWTIVQQFLLQCFFLLRLRRLAPGRKLRGGRGRGLFALAHLPNPILTPGHLVWGLAACLLFLHYRNLYPLAVAHAIFGITIAITIPGPVDHNMRVGLGYLTYHQHMYRLATSPKP